jgi:hypothetical protein
MTLTRALAAEALKIKRTLALKMVVLAPLAVVLLTLFMASQAPFSTLHKGRNAVDPWRALSRVNLQFWGLLMLPMYVTLQTALLAGLDHADNQWKVLFARPVPRWTTYIAKLLVVMAMTAVSTSILVGGILAEGSFLGWFKTELDFGAAPVVFIAGQAAQMTGLAFLFLSIQHWVSLRWKSFAVAIGFGVVALVTSFAMLLAAGQYGAWPEYFPWSLPMLVIAHQPHNVAPILWICAFIGIGMNIAGCVDFCKREVS